MKKEHVVKCINIALVKGTLNHLEIVDEVRRIGYITSQFDEDVFWRILNKEVAYGRIFETETTDGFMLYYLP